MMRNRLHALYYPVRVKLSGPDAYPLHDHDFGEVAWMDEGSSLIHQVNGHEMELTTGSFLFIRPSDAHSFHDREAKPAFLINICFQWHLYESLKQRYFSGSTAVYGEDSRLPKTLQLTEGQLQSARSAFLFLLKAPQSSFQIERFLINLFAELCPLVGEDALDQAPQWMRSAWQCIQRPEHLCLGVAEFYRLCGRSPEHVSREFHKQTGRTVVQSIVKLRMAHAAALLAGTTDEIIDISEQCGFESLSHFYACFHKAHGLTPRAFRKRAQTQMYAS